ncbi:MAG: Arm DNA-binding domain-containing protein [Elainella sp.]
MTRAKKNTCTVYDRDGMLCIRFNYRGKLYRKSPGMPDLPEFRIKSQELAAKIQLSILSDTFEPEKLDQYLFNKPDPGIGEKLKVKKKQYPKNSPKRRAFSKDEVCRIIAAFENDELK